MEDSSRKSLLRYDLSLFDLENIHFQMYHQEISY
jgi:hypothetical protein